MKTKLLIEKHQTCIEILEGIQRFERQIKLTQDNINGFAGTFSQLRRKYKHNIDIYNMCIVRLTERYKKVIDFVLTNKL